MLKKYDIPEETPTGAAEPAVAYMAEPRVSGNWGPNAMFTGTQDEFMAHIRSIEAGEFMTLEEFDSRFEKWKKEYLSKKLR